MKNRPQADAIEKAKACAFFLLKFRLRTEQEIYQRLKKKKFEEPVITQTIDFLKAKNFLDDVVFSKAWIQSRINKPIGLRRLALELRQKGVDQKIIQGQLGRVKEGYREEEIVHQLAQAKWQAVKGLEPQKAKRRIYAALVRRGFSPDIVMDVVQQL